MNSKLLQINLFGMILVSAGCSPTEPKSVAITNQVDRFPIHILETGTIPITLVDKPPASPTKGPGEFGPTNDWTIGYLAAPKENNTVINRYLLVLDPFGPMDDATGKMHKIKIDVKTAGWKKVAGTDFEFEKVLTSLPGGGTFDSGQVTVTISSLKHKKLKARCVIDAKLTVFGTNGFQYTALVGNTAYLDFEP